MKLRQSPKLSAVVQRTILHAVPDLTWSLGPIATRTPRSHVFPRSDRDSGPSKWRVFSVRLRPGPLEVLYFLGPIATQGPPGRSPGPPGGGLKGGNHRICPECLNSCIRIDLFSYKNPPVQHQAPPPSPPHAGVADLPQFYMHYTARPLSSSIVLTNSKPDVSNLT